MSSEAAGAGGVSAAAGASADETDPAAASQHFEDVEHASKATEELVIEDDEEDENSGEENAYSSDDESEGGDLEWNVGFVEPMPEGHAEKRRAKQAMQRQHFPCKVGGRPAWLDPVDVPTATQLKCLYTREPLDFLMQIYAPVDDEPNAFHRSVFVFVSPHGGDLHRPGAVRAFRSQLPRENAFYPDAPATIGGLVQELSAEQQRAYDRRNDRWADRPSDGGSAGRRLKTFPEAEILVEPETFDDDPEGSGGDDGRSDSEDDPEDDPEDDEKSKRRRSRHAKRVSTEEPFDLEASLKKGSDVTARELRELEKMQDKDQVQLSRFHLRLRRSDPTQVVRYCFEDGAEPLWPSVTRAPQRTDRTVPPCPRCLAPRKFEFQVLPQIINHLDVDSELASAVDFGTMAVYTCSKSCALTAGGHAERSDDGTAEGIPEMSAAYAEEIVLVHPPLNA
jgi:pre-rRNA-processing protein TSR4